MKDIKQVAREQGWEEMSRAHAVTSFIVGFLVLMAFTYEVVGLVGSLVFSSIFSGFITIVRIDFKNSKDDAISYLETLKVEDLKERKNKKEENELLRYFNKRSNQ